MKTKVKKSRSVKWNVKCMLCLVPSLIGTLVFYVIPYIRMLYYSVIENQFHRNFVGFQNYIDVLSNHYFQLALINSLLIILIAVPVLIILSLFISIGLSIGIRKLSATRAAFILPMLIPTASAALIWRTAFTGESTPIPIYLLFIWKNLGLCVILLTAALTSIDRSLFESAKLDGANAFRLHTRITIPIIAPTVVFTTLLAIVNSFKIFKESYLFYGSNYPPDHSYTLQYYMNNNFLKLDYQSLASSAVITSLIVLLIVLCGMGIQRRYSK